jgi:hypothetical protein
MGTRDIFGRVLRFQPSGVEGDMEKSVFDKKFLEGEDLSLMC